MCDIFNELEYIEARTLAYETLTAPISAKDSAQAAVFVGHTSGLSKSMVDVWHAMPWGAHYEFYYGVYLGYCDDDSRTVECAFAIKRMQELGNAMHAMQMESLAMHQQLTAHVVDLGDALSPHIPVEDLRSVILSYLTSLV